MVVHTVWPVRELSAADKLSAADRISPTPMTVSYTHLDVYKRQPVFPNGIRTKINYKLSIALDLVSVKI